MNAFSSGKFPILIFLTLIAAGSLFAEDNGGPVPPPIDPASYVGFTLEKLFEELGMPVSVHALRGNEAWQDDVVFVYPAIEVYLFKDRVWQLCLLSVYDMKINDSIDQVKAVMGEALIVTEKYLVYQLQSNAWPMMMRINLNEEGRAAAFFIYRSDI